MNKYLAIVLIVAMICMAVVAVAEAQPDEPIELRPSYILMDELQGGDIRRGVVYAFDGGWILADADDLVYTCGCEVCDDEAIEALTYATIVSKDGPTPTNKPPSEPTPVDTPIPPVDTPVPPIDTPVPPTDEPETKANCGLGNGPEDADPNENACGKKTGEENE
jgi:hypothetical protein